MDMLGSQSDGFFLKVRNLKLKFADQKGSPLYSRIDELKRKDREEIGKAQK